ncbi:cell cycle checkpoint control protein RAD9B isoform X2 [Pseudophryne corroboree]|uniref:cell cycle checkpoint control protein RAD9B isoform X2 n=1 Tax=Pseudophryne corroboree TaxID=495146 RepID=UPI0030821877
MKCVIPGGHLKVFGKALHSLSRIGDDLWFDPLDKGSVLPVFRCLSTLERNVEKCHLNINFNTCHVVFQLLCKHGLTKTHNLTYEDHEPLQAVFSKTTCPNVLKIQSRVFSDIIIHFPTSQEEVTLTATPLKISFRSYNEEELGFSKGMHTEIQLSPDEFDYFQIGVDTEITFCLKEVRGLLSFAETTSALISLYFSKSGQPVVFSIDDMVFEANFILATLADVEDSTSSQLSCGTVFESTPLVKQKRVSNALDDSYKENIRNPRLLPTENPMLLTRIAPEKQNIYTPVEMEPHHPASFNKFCTLFFGAISPKQQDKSSWSFSSLATASEDEEDGFCRDLSQTF